MHPLASNELDKAMEQSWPGHGKGCFFSLETYNYL